MLSRLKNIVFIVVLSLPMLISGQNKQFDAYIDSTESCKNEDFVRAKLYSDSAINLAKQKNNNEFFARAYNASSNVLVANGRYKEGLEELVLAENYNKKNGNKLILSAILNNRAICYERLSQYGKSLETHLKALSLRQELKKTKEVGASLQNIGAVYFYLGNYDQCISNTKKAIEIAEQLKDRKLVGELYDNLGSVYFTTYKDTLAQKCMQKALDIAIETNNKIGIESAYNNLSSFYIETGRPMLGKEYLRKALELLNNNPERTASIMQNMGTLFAKLKIADSALFYYGKALVLANSIGNKYRAQNIYKDVSAFYYSIKDYQHAYEYQDRYFHLKDSLTSEANLKSIREVEAIYKTEKQSKEIEALNSENKLQKENAESRKKLLWVSLGCLLLAVFAAIAFYLNFRNKKRDNIILQDKNIEIEKQKDLIAEKNKEIVDSINYAKRLQDAILPSVELIKKHLPQSFILYKPKDIVAGDFYWMFYNSKSNITLIAVADCTGHGVPGALVSVVCANALNSAVKEFGLVEPAKILDKVNELVEEAFGKSTSEVNDGMDISLVKIEAINDHPDNKLPKGKMVIPKGQSLSEYIEANKKYNIQWSGANNPLWYIKDGIMFEIKADKQPVGKFEHRKPFTNHSLELKVNDSLFLISDGYADQFGGELGKKINTKSVKDLLFKNSNASSQRQKEILETEFAQWKGSNDQVDDVTIMGVKF